jgi:hypothetical protein
MLNDVRDGVSYTVQTYERYSLPQPIMRLNLSGRDFNSMINQTSYRKRK